MGTVVVAAVLVCVVGLILKGMHKDKKMAGHLAEVIAAAVAAAVTDKREGNL